MKLTTIENERFGINAKDTSDDDRGGFFTVLKITIYNNVGLSNSGGRFSGISA